MCLSVLRTGEITAAMVRGLKGQGRQILVLPRSAPLAAPLAAKAHVDAIIRSYRPERARERDLASALKKLSTEGGLNATLRTRLAPAKDTLFDGFHARFRLEDTTMGRT